MGVRQKETIAQRLFFLSYLNLKLVCKEDLRVHLISTVPVCKLQIQREVVGRHPDKEREGFCLVFTEVDV